MSFFYAGQRVRLKNSSIEGTVARVREVMGFTGGQDEIRIQVKDHGQVIAPESLVERAEPENWPPHIGDIWVTPNGEEYYVRQDHLWGTEIIIAPFTREGKTEYYTKPNKLGNEHAVDAFMKLWPVLIRRRA